MSSKLILAVSIFASFHAAAIENGTLVDWEKDFDDFVSGNCTGLVVGGNKILTAGHCGIVKNKVVGHDGANIAVNSRVDHPKYNYYSNYDFSVLDVANIKTQNIHFFADLSQPTAVKGDTVTAFGFGGSPKTLKKGDFKIERVSSVSIDMLYHRYEIGSVKTVNGDSGGAWFNSSNKIIGLTHGGEAVSDLFYAKEFLLDKVNGWHYPTVLKGTGTKTVRVQSLHKNSVVDAAYVAGDVTITGGTCQSKATIDAFDTCTYTLDVKGSGKLHLTSNETVDINPVSPKPVPPKVAPAGSGGSGGSLGIIGLFGLALAGRLRCKK